MRLIDADAISWELVDVGYIPVITKEEIDAMPTVDAIPVSFLQKLQETAMNDGAYEMINEIIARWEKERGNT